MPPVPSKGVFPRKRAGPLPRDREPSHNVDRGPLVIQAMDRGPRVIHKRVPRKAHPSYSWTADRGATAASLRLACLGSRWHGSAWRGSARLGSAPHGFPCTADRSGQFRRDRGPRPPAQDGPWTAAWREPVCRGPQYRGPWTATPRGAFPCATPRARSSPQQMTWTANENPCTGELSMSSQLASVLSTGAMAL